MAVAREVDGPTRKRRKEVALGNFRTLTIVLALGAWGAATEGSPPDDGPAATPSSGTLPAPPASYLRGGVQLYNTGQPDLAAKYLKVASDHRDQLQPAEQAQLDDYLARLRPAPVDPAVRPAATPSDLALGAATSSSPSASAPAPAGGSLSSRPPSPIAPPRSPGELKSEARWKLQRAREELGKGNYDEATKIVAEVQAMDVKWGLFDETPAKLAERIAKERPKSAASVSGPRDKKQAMAKLKEAKDLIANQQFEQAEAIAMEVNSWGLRYSMWEEKPEKIAAAARALRKRDQIRNTSVRKQDSQNVYDVLVSDARHLMAARQYDQAEAKARQALGMNVVPSLAADKAGDVLADIASARARDAAAKVAVASNSPSPAPAAFPAVAEPASVVKEREANELLAQGKNREALALANEANALQAREAAQPAVAAAEGPAPISVVDPAVRQVAAQDPPALEAMPPAADGPPALVDPAAPPQAMPAPDVASPLPAAAPSISIPDATAPGNKGEDLLAQARSLASAGNFAAARDKAAEAKAGGYGVDAAADEMVAQIALAEQGGALAVYEAALEALRGKTGPDYAKARALLNEVAASGASLDEGMRQKVEDLLQKLPADNNAAPSGKATASDVAVNDAEALRAQAMNAEVGTRVAEARRMMETDPAAAIALLEKTLGSVKAADLPPAVARTMTRRLEVAIELAKKDKVGFDKKMQDKGYKAEIETKKLRILEADKAKRAAMKDLMSKAEEAQSKGDWAKAEEYARRALEVDPSDVAATMLAFKANVQRHYDVDMGNKKAKEEGFLNEMQDVDKTMVINTEASRNGISFPKTFKEMSERRKKMAMSDMRQKSIQELAIEKKLNEPITINLKDQTLDEAVNFISNYTGLNVILDPKALNDEGLSRDSKVSITLNGAKLKTALKFMLQPLGLTYKTDDDVLMITSPQASRDKTYPWTYPVADLVVPPNRSTAPVVANPTSVPLGQAPNDLTAGQGMGMSLATPGAAPQQGWTTQQRLTVAEMMPLVNLITNTIAPNTWRVTDAGSADPNSYGMGNAFGGAGGADAAQPGSITPFLLSISLIIRHTAEVHEEVAELLRQLRRLQDLQVTIEVRFITVSDDFFEQIGVDFDFNIQSGAVGKNTSFAAPSGSLQAASYPFNLVSNGGTAGTTTGGVGGTSTTTGGGLSGASTTGGTGSTGTTGTTGGGLGGTTGGTAGGTTGGFAGGGTTGGVGGGISGGGFAGGGGGVGGAGSFGGGTSGQGNTTTGGALSGIGYVVNPFLDHSLGRKTPIVVGTQAGGLGNYTPNLGIPLIQNSASAIAPFNAVPGAGATFGIAFLSDLEMYLFLTAAQGDARNNIVQAPKVTTFNGASATLVNQQSQAYVQSISPVISFAAVAFQPQIGQLNDGVQLQVTPVVSADRRYVRLALAPNFNTIDGLQTITFPAGAVGGSGLGGSGAGINSTIQLPIQTQTQINTTVTVPDGGTVLLGGVKRMREQRLEYGVPVLAKTPFINRLFRNIGIGRRTDSLMLMVTPRIIILEEEEDRLGIRTVAPTP